MISLVSTPANKLPKGKRTDPPPPCNSTYKTNPLKTPPFTLDPPTSQVSDLISLGTAVSTLANELPKQTDPASEQLRLQLLQWHMANVEFANASRLDALSLRDWDQVRGRCCEKCGRAGRDVGGACAKSDDAYEVLEEHVLLPGSNLCLASGTPQSPDTAKLPLLS